MKNKNNQIVSWCPPPKGWVKLNSDGSFVGRDSNGGAGFVARDSNGRFLFAGASDCPGVTPLYSELFGMRFALTEAKNASLPRVILESDSSSAVQLVGEGVSEYAPRGSKLLVQQCQDLRDSFPEIIIQHTYREGNSVADRLAAVGRQSKRNQFFEHFIELPDAATKDNVVFDMNGGGTVRHRKI